MNFSPGKLRVKRSRGYIRPHWGVFESDGTCILILDSHAVAMNRAQHIAQRRASARRIVQVPTVPVQPAMRIASYRPGFRPDILINAPHHTAGVHIYRPEYVNSEGKVHQQQSMFISWSQVWKLASILISLAEQHEQYLYESSLQWRA